MPSLSQIPRLGVGTPPDIEALGNGWRRGSGQASLPLEACPCEGRKTSSQAGEAAGCSALCEAASWLIPAVRPEAVAGWRRWWKAWWPESQKAGSLLPSLLCSQAWQAEKAASSVERHHSSQAIQDRAAGCQAGVAEPGELGGRAAPAAWKKTLCFPASLSGKPALFPALVAPGYGKYSGKTNL